MFQFEVASSHSTDPSTGYIESHMLVQTLCVCVFTSSVGVSQQ